MNLVRFFKEGNLRGVGFLPYGTREVLNVAYGPTSMPRLYFGLDLARYGLVVDLTVFKYSLYIMLFSEIMEVEPDFEF